MTVATKRLPFWLVLLAAALVAGVLTQAGWVYAAYADIQMEHVGSTYWGDVDEEGTDSYYYFQWTPTHNVSTDANIYTQAYFINEDNEEQAYRATIAYDRDYVRFTNDIWSLYGCEIHTEFSIATDSGGDKVLTVKWGYGTDRPVEPDGCAGGQLLWRWLDGDADYDWRQLDRNGSDTLLFHAGDSCSHCPIRVASNDTVKIH